MVELLAVTTIGLIKYCKNGMVPGRMIQVLAKSQAGLVLPLAAVEDVKLVCTIMFEVVMPVTPALTAPLTPSIPGFDWEP